jgi:hypothetical protein
MLGHTVGNPKRTGKLTTDSPTETEYFSVIPCSGGGEGGGAGGHITADVSTCEICESATGIVTSGAGRQATSPGDYTVKATTDSNHTTQGTGNPVRGTGEATYIVVIEDLISKLSNGTVYFSISPMPKDDEGFLCKPVPTDDDPTTSSSPLALSSPNR